MEVNSCIVQFFSRLDNPMEKIARLSLTTTVFILSILAVAGQSSKTIAQIRGQGTEPFFDRGNQQIEREIQRLQNRQEEEIEQKDQALEIERQQNFDPKKPENPQLEESIPATDTDSNRLESPQPQIEVE